MKLTIPSLLLLIALTGCAATPTTSESTTSSGHHPTVTTTAPTSFHDIVWRWRDTVDAQGNTVKPENPERYTLQFRADERVAVVADCNRGSAPYAVTQNQLTIEPVAMTRMFCFGASQADQFLAGLLEVKSFSFVDSAMQLQLRNGGTMTFTRSTAM